ncbi:MAG: hypothetical protein IT317_23395 [Anaerolineales bacterium]|nr:hypothetical protein [Anaerolineales bacterium]
MSRLITIRRGLAGVALALAGCAVNPLTPPPLPTGTLPPAIVLVASATLTHTATLAPTARPRTPVPSVTPATLAPTDAALGEAIGPTSTPPSVAVDVGSAATTGQTEPLAATAPPTVLEPAPTPIPPVWVAPPVSADVAAGEQYTIDLINAQRANIGLPPLARDETLMGIARARVADMVARGYTGHNDPVTGVALGRSMILAAGYRLAGENWYGTHTGPPGTGEVAMNWFMTDDLHARAILNPNYTVVGVGLAFNGAQWLLIQNFAAP